MAVRKSSTRYILAIGLILAVASALSVYHLAVDPYLLQMELEETELAFAKRADPAATEAKLTLGHEHGHDGYGPTGRTITDPAHVELLLSVVKQTVEGARRDRWSHYDHRLRLKLTNSSGESVIWLSTDRSGWSFGAQPESWYGGGLLLHVVFGVVYLAAGPDADFYPSLKGYVSALRLLSRDEMSAWMDILTSLAPLVAKIEENPETPLEEFWEHTGLSADDLDSR